jgi:hypothetical protein
MDTTLDAVLRGGSHGYVHDERCDWLSALGVVVPWRLKYPDERVYSGPGASTRFDYIFADAGVVALYHQDSVYLANRYGGDHLVHTSTFTLGGSAGTNSGPKPWRLPKELLASPRLCNLISTRAKALLQAWEANPECNVGAQWYGWLKALRTVLMREHHLRLDSVHAELQKLRAAWLMAEAMATLRHTSTEAVAAAKTDYDAAHAEVIQLKRDRGYEWLSSHHESAASYFLRKPAGLKIPISTATVAGAAPTTDPTKVASIFTNHWRDVMRADGPTPRPSIGVNRRQRRHVCRSVAACVGRLRPEQREDLDKDLDPAELGEAIRRMSPNKSPGPDGWPPCFFQVAKDVFAAILLT